MGWAACVSRRASRSHNTPQRGELRTRRMKPKQAKSTVAGLSSRPPSASKVAKVFCGATAPFTPTEGAPPFIPPPPPLLRAEDPLPPPLLLLAAAAAFAFSVIAEGGAPLWGGRRGKGRGGRKGRGKARVKKGGSAVRTTSSPSGVSTLSRRGRREAYRNPDFERSSATPWRPVTFTHHPLPVVGNDRNTSAVLVCWLPPDE